MSRLTGTDALGLFEAYQAVYTETEQVDENFQNKESIVEGGFPNVKPSVRAGDAGTSGLKMTTGGYINKHSGGEVLPSGTVNKIMRGDLMVKGKTSQPTTQVAHFDIFDLIKGYLLDEGYADTEETAISIMANMSEEWRQSIIEMNDFEAGGGNAQMKKTGMDRAAVEKLGAKNLAKAPKSSSSSSGGRSSGGSFSPGKYDINVNFGKPPAPQDSSNDARILSKIDALRQKKFGPNTAKAIFSKPDYDVPSFADTSDDLARSQAQDHDEWLVAKGRQKPGYRGTQDIANRTIAKQRAYYGQK